MGRKRRARLAQKQLARLKQEHSRRLAARGGRCLDSLPIRHLMKLSNALRQFCPPQREEGHCAEMLAHGAGDDSGYGDATRHIAPGDIFATDALG